MKYILVIGALVFGIWFAVHETKLFVEDIKRKNAEKKAKKAEKAKNAENAEKIDSDAQPVSEEKNTNPNK